MGLIYKIANDINDKVYIGQTVQNLKARMRGHRFDSKIKEYPLYKAIRKYGWNHFFFEVVEDNIPIEDLNEKEIYYTNKFNALNPNGYVLIAGGKPRIISEEARKRRSEKMKGNRRHLGFKHSEETKEKLRQKLSGISLTEEHKRKIKEKHPKGKNHPLARIISCFDKNKTFLKDYDCINDAAKELNLSPSLIVAVCKGKRNHTGNYFFEYK